MGGQSLADLIRKEEALKKELRECRAKIRGYIVEAQR